MFEVLMFNNGNVAVFKEGEQIDDLQAAGWLGAWLNHVEDLGYDPEGWIISLPCNHQAKVFRREDNGWTWEIL